MPYSFQAMFDGHGQWWLSIATQAMRQHVAFGHDLADPVTLIEITRSGRVSRGRREILSAVIHGLSKVLTELGAE
ncbi:hypothetical protein [Methylococcus sp. EFPC2]|uniref:hypothetical protein n=1 Tax=Methylococcus sp. EFPC2 TaxID=2812648 RepID=UPI0019682603|nr:hypothetical protein [Methylococcus sp. EFPC2]QSA98119.1 hypothetical protein JWZ97_04690 [Methylococcus sp. EFPC2]